jgi:hypothetical protein
MDRTEVLAVEVQQYVESGDSGLVTLVPRVLGQTIESQQKKRTTQTNQRSWNEASFFEEASHQLPEDEVGTLRAIYEWSVTNMSRISYGKGRTMGSFAGVLDLPSGQSWPINCYTNGFVEFTFQYMEFMKAFRDRGMRHKFLERLLLIKGFNPPVDDTILSRRPSIAVRELVSPGEMQKLIEALDWFVAEAKAG